LTWKQSNTLAGSVQPKAVISLGRVHLDTVLTGNWKIPMNPQAFLSAGSGDFPVARSRFRASVQGPSQDAPRIAFRMDISTDG
jgi:hypothetical protein